MGRLRDAWEHNAQDWVRWARTPGHDMFFWGFNLPTMLTLIPPPSGLTVDLGCGEGRLGRELARLGHRVIGVEGSPTLARAAATHGLGHPVVVGDASSLPLAAAQADLVVASMMLMDVDDLDGAVGEAARVLRPCGYLCFSILHPMSTSGSFASQDDPHAAFALNGSYFEEARQAIRLERGGLAMTFNGEHRPLRRYFAALERAGFAVKALREPEVGPDVAAADPNWQRWTRVPNTLHVLAVRG